MEEEHNNGEQPINGRHPTCAACKHQRRKCATNCVIAPYFSVREMGLFDAVHKIFGVSNVSKLLKSLEERDRGVAAKSLKWEAIQWERERVVGPLGRFMRLSAEKTELETQVEEQKKQIESLVKQLEQQKELIELLKGRLELLRTGADSSTSTNYINETDSYLLQQMMMNPETPTHPNGTDHSQLSGNGAAAAAHGESNGTLSVPPLTRVDNLENLVTVQERDHQGNGQVGNNGVRAAPPYHHHHHHPMMTTDHQSMGSQGRSFQSMPPLLSYTQDMVTCIGEENNWHYHGNDGGGNYGMNLQGGYGSQLLIGNNTGNGAVPMRINGGGIQNLQVGGSNGGLTTADNDHVSSGQETGLDNQLPKDFFAGL